MTLGTQRMFGSAGAAVGFRATMTANLTYSFGQSVASTFEPGGNMSLGNNGLGLVTKKIGWGRNLGSGNEAKGFMYVALPAGTYSVFMTKQQGETYMLEGNSNVAWDFRIGAGYGSDTLDNFTFTSATTNFARAVSGGVGYVEDVTVHDIVVGTSTGSGTDDYEITPLLGTISGATWSGLGGTSPSGIGYHVVRTGSAVNVSVYLAANITIIKTA